MPAPPATAWRRASRRSPEELPPVGRLARDRPLENWSEAPEVSRRRLLILAESRPCPSGCSDYDPPFLLRPRHKVAVGFAVDEAEQNLVGEHRSAERALRVLPWFSPKLLTPTCSTSPDSTKALHPRHGRAGRKQRARPVLLVQVDVVDAQAPRTRPSRTRPAAGCRSEKASWPQKRDRGDPGWPRRRCAQTAPARRSPRYR